MGDIIIGGIILILAGLALFAMIRARKTKGDMCAGCSGCANQSACHPGAVSDSNH